MVKNGLQSPHGVQQWSLVYWDVQVLLQSFLDRADRLDPFGQHSCLRMEQK